MKWLSGLLGFLVLVLVLCFALSNQQNVSIEMWPFDGVAQAPLYIVGFAPLLFGLMIGGFWGWLGSVPHRLRARRLYKELDALNQQIGELQKTALVQSVQAVRKKHFWERKI